MSPVLLSPSPLCSHTRCPPIHVWTQSCRSWCQAPWPVVLAALLQVSWSFINVWLCACPQEAHDPKEAWGWGLGEFLALTLALSLSPFTWEMQTEDLLPGDDAFSLPATSLWLWHVTTRVDACHHPKEDVAASAPSRVPVSSLLQGQRNRRSGASPPRGGRSRAARPVWTPPTPCTAVSTMGSLGSPGGPQGARRWMWVPGRAQRSPN